MTRQNILFSLKQVCFRETWSHCQCVVHLDGWVLKQHASTEKPDRGVGRTPQDASKLRGAKAGFLVQRLKMSVLDAYSMPETERVLFKRASLVKSPVDQENDFLSRDSFRTRFASKDMLWSSP